MVIELNVKARTTKFLGENLEILRQVKISKYNTKSQTMKEKLINWTASTFKTIALQKLSLRHQKVKSRNGENICNTYMAKYLYPEYTKNS